jgi:hypothetical protein|tara:strand:- start:392 stop:730 length:339 start_codon:yes stop_codon:yes gene_type:complete
MANGIPMMGNGPPMPQIPTGQGPSPMPLGYTEGPGGIHGTDNLGGPIDTRPGPQDEVGQLLALRDQIDQRLSEITGGQIPGGGPPGVPSGPPPMDAMPPSGGMPPGLLAGAY